MVTAKDRRHNGWISPNTAIKYHFHDTSTDPELEPQPFWDDWSEYRDGQRDIFTDYKKIKEILPVSNAETRIKMNRKQKRLLKIREAKKHGRSCIILN